MGIKQRVTQVYNSNSNQELSENYDTWASDYEQDMIGDSEYLSPKKTAEKVLKYVPKTAIILDAGAGTGMAGEILYQQGYRNLVAIDISPEMLKKAREKNIYTDLYQQVLGEPLDFSSKSFDAIISVGVFTYNHAPSNAFDELIRITKPGGYIVFTMRPDFYESSEEFQLKMTYLTESSQWQFIERGDRYYPHPNSNLDTSLEIWVYQLTVNN